MGQLIRHGVFETNSSSTHSLVVDRNGDYVGMTPDENGAILCYPQNFGWTRREFSDPEIKLAYLLIYIRDWIRDETGKIMHAEVLRKMVEDHTGATSVRLRTEDEGADDDGYIDHQSVENGELEGYFEDPALMKDFVFGRKSTLITDNDNY